MNEIIIGILALIVGVLVTRWIFGIGQMLKMGKTQIGLLILLAKKNGATADEVDEVLNKVYPKDWKPPVQAG